MNEKIISAILIILSSLAALFFVVKQNFEMAVLFICIMFTLTNFFRSKSFKMQGYEKEAKWMRTMAVIFGISAIVVLIIIIY